jgi:hypothetical protein
MKLATLEKYVALVYAPGSAPSLSTLRRRILDIPGGRVDLGRYYVDLDANDKVQQLGRELQNHRTQAKKNPNLAGLI